MTSTARPDDAPLPMVLVNMPIPEIATLYTVVVDMMKAVAGGVRERSCGSDVGKVDACPVTTWTRDGAVLTAWNAVDGFAGVEDAEALHLVLQDGTRSVTIVEAGREDGSNHVGRSEDPRAAAFATLDRLRASLAACPTYRAGWVTPKTQADHVVDASLQHAIAASIPSHVDAVVAMSGQDRALFVKVVMPSPYGPARYDGAEEFARDARSLERAVAKASRILPRCIMAASEPGGPTSDPKWRISAYRTGLEMLESTGGAMETLRVLASLEKGSGPKG
jgi:hypothetical protein